MTLADPPLSLSPAVSSGSVGCRPGSDVTLADPPLSLSPAVSSGSVGCRSGGDVTLTDPPLSLSPAVSSGSVGCRSGGDVTLTDPPLSLSPAVSSGSVGCRSGGDVDPSMGQLQTRGSQWKDPAAALDQVISQSHEEGQCLLYKLANYKKGTTMKPGHGEGNAGSHFFRNIQRLGIMLSMKLAYAVLTPQNMSSAKCLRFFTLRASVTYLRGGTL